MFLERGSSTRFSASDFFVYKSSPALDFFEFGFKFAEILEKEHESAVTETMLIQFKLMLKGQSSEI
jgi:hypothetical protein